MAVWRWHMAYALVTTPAGAARARQPEGALEGAPLQQVPGAGGQDAVHKVCGMWWYAGCVIEWCHFGIVGYMHAVHHCG